jgi:hypothetical protein
MSRIPPIAATGIVTRVFSFSLNRGGVTTLKGVPYVVPFVALVVLGRR